VSKEGYEFNSIYDTVISVSYHSSAKAEMLPNSLSLFLRIYKNRDGLNKTPFPEIEYNKKKCNPKITFSQRND
jgi:hypothetical protein